jgi:hypothetical protein
MKKKVVNRKIDKKIIKKSDNKPVRKMTVGEDEFCSTCMEWRAFDELTGKCCVCGHIIKKINRMRTVTDEYDLKDFTIEHDEQQDTNES